MKVCVWVHKSALRACEFTVFNTVTVHREFSVHKCGVMEMKKIRRPLVKTVGQISPFERQILILRTLLACANNVMVHNCHLRAGEGRRGDG